MVQDCNCRTPIRSYDELCEKTPPHPLDTDQEHHDKVFDALFEATGMNAKEDIDSILKAYATDPCRRQKIIAHLKTVYRLGEDASERLLGLKSKMDAMPVVDEDQCLTLALFNFKGGVGKTTMTTNVAAALAQMGFRVGVVDADVQGNTTGYFCGAPEDGGGGSDDVPSPEDAHINASLNHDLPEDIPSPDLDTALESDIPMLHEKLEVVKQNQQAGFEDAHPDYRDEFYKMKPISHLPGVNLKLLGGGPELAQIDEDFSPKLSRRYHLKSNEGMLVGSFRMLLKRLAKNNGLQVILVDVGPSSSLFNAWLVTSCDYILPPAFADKFSALSIRDFVHSVIPSFRDKQAYWLRSMWLDDKEAIKKNSEYLFNPLTVVFPFMLGKFAVNNNGGSTKVVKASATWVNAIRQTLNKAAEEKLKVKERDSLMNGTLLLQDYLMHNKQYYCTFLKELQSEVPIAQKTRIPLVCLRVAHFKGLGQAPQRIDYIQGRYRTLSKFLLETWTKSGARFPAVADTGLELAPPSDKKQKITADNSVAFDENGDDLKKEPEKFKTLLLGLVNRAREVATELKLTQHGDMSEDTLTEQMVHGKQVLSTLLHEAGFPDAVVHHQYTLSEGRPDIVLVNVKFEGHECHDSEGNLPIVVEIKKETHAEFNRSSTLSAHQQQVKKYRDPRLGNLARPSPYAVLLNFEKNSWGVQLLWAKFDDQYRALRWH